MFHQRVVPILLGVLGLILAIFATASAAQPVVNFNGAGIIVTTTNPGIASDGQCSLVEAIVNANADDQSGSSDCAAGAGTDTIYLLPNREILFSQPYAGKNALPPVTSHIILRGQNAQLRHSPNTDVPTSRFFYVEANGSLEIYDLALVHGDSGDENGGAIFNQGKLIIGRSAITDCTSRNSGGGLINELGDVEVFQSRIAQNTAGDGGGIHNSGGKVKLVEVTIEANQATGEGGGIRNVNGDLLIVQSDISDNRAMNGGGVYSVARWGSIMENLDLSDSTVVINNSDIHDNVAEKHGGGLDIEAHGVNYSWDLGYDATSNTEIESSRIESNQSTDGGGVYSAARISLSAGGDNHISLRNSTIAQNQASNDGGGVFNTAATSDSSSLVDLSQSTIMKNVASNHGGGLFNWVGSDTIRPDVAGSTAKIVLENVTVSGNVATKGGGIGNIAELTGLVSIQPSATMHIGHSTITANDADSGGGIFLDARVQPPYSLYEILPGMTVKNSIVADQQSGDDCHIIDNSRLKSEGYNIETSSHCGFNGSGDLTATDPQLGILAANGGSTQTHALESDSPVIDHIPVDVNDCAPGTSKDQRGAYRAFGEYRGGEGCDCGSYEANSQAPDSCSLDTIVPEGGIIVPLRNASVSAPLLLAADVKDNFGGVGVKIVRFTWAPRLTGPWSRIESCQWVNPLPDQNHFLCVWDMEGVYDGEFVLGLEIHDWMGNRLDRIRVLEKQPGPVDVTPPDGDMISPDQHVTVYPPLRMAAEAEDNQGGSGVALVRFMAQWDGSWVGLFLDGQAPFEFTWDMAGVPEGSLIVGIEIYDASGNRAETSPLRRREITKLNPPLWTPVPTQTPVPACTPFPIQLRETLWLPMVWH